MQDDVVNERLNVSCEKGLRIHPAANTHANSSVNTPTFRRHGLKNWCIRRAPSAGLSLPAADANRGASPCDDIISVEPQHAIPLSTAMNSFGFADDHAGSNFQHVSDDDLSSCIVASHLVRKLDGQLNSFNTAFSVLDRAVNSHSKRKACSITVGWKFTTGIEFRLRHGLDYGLLMRHEHVNNAKEICEVLCVFFKSIRRSVFGIAPALSFYQFFECAEPDLRQCADYLSSRDLTR